MGIFEPIQKDMMAIYEASRLPVIKKPFKQWLLGTVSYRVVNMSLYGRAFAAGSAKRIEQRKRK